MKAFFLLGAVAALDCSNQGFMTQTPNGKDVQVVYDGHLYSAQWSASQVPGNDLAWLDLGACDTLPPTPACWAPYDSSIQYANPNSRVSIDGFNWINSWWAGAGEKPVSSSTNWLRLHSCGDGGAVVTPPSTSTKAPVTSTTTGAPTSTTTKPVVATNPPAPTNPPVPTNPPTTSTAPPTTTTAAVSTTSSATTPAGASQRPTGPTGPNGECVWPLWDKLKIYGQAFSFFVTHNGGVYEKSYYCSPGQEPGVDPCWKPKLTTCTGSPPVVKLTAAELAGMVNPSGQKYQMFLDKWDPTTPTPAEMAAEISNIESTYSEAQKRVMTALKVLDMDSIEAITPGRAANPENVKRVERVITLSIFNQLFPVRHPAYTYENLLKGVGAFPAYCQTYSDGRDSDKICLNLLITSFAHNTQEVGGNNPSLTYKNTEHMVDGGIHYHQESDAYFTAGQPIAKWQQALWYLREIAYSEDVPSSSPYRKCSPDSADSMMWALNYQCPAGVDYFGRGAKQLSWNYNYGMFSKLFFGDASYLLANPHLVADSWLNFGSGIWFSVTPQSPKPSMLEVLDGSWVPNSVDMAAGIQAGFGATINIINGAYECNKDPSEQVQNRIEAYKKFAAFFNYQIPASEQLDCSRQTAFQAGGAGDMNMYWGNSWSVPFTCQLIGYQSAFLAGIPGDYENCVNYWFRARWVDRDTRTVMAQYGNVGATATPPV